MNNILRISGPQRERARSPVAVVLGQDWVWITPRSLGILSQALQDCGISSENRAVCTFLPGLPQENVSQWENADLPLDEVLRAGRELQGPGCFERTGMEEGDGFLAALGRLVVFSWLQLINY